MRTFSFTFIPLARNCSRLLLSTGSRRSESSSARGFTLIEMMVVVLVITLVATLAVPSVSKRMQSNETSNAAQIIASAYRTARLQAMGRGSAVVVRYNAGTFQILEGILGVGVAPAGCDPLPAASCTTPVDRWDAGSPGFQVLESYNFAGGQYTVTTQDTATRTLLDVCFSPSGRAYTRTAATGALTPMTTPVDISIERTDAVGLQRRVAVSPSGSARVVAEP